MTGYALRAQLHCKIKIWCMYIAYAYTETYLVKTDKIWSNADFDRNLRCFKEVPETLNINNHRISHREHFPD